MLRHMIVDCRTSRSPKYGITVKLGLFKYTLSYIIHHFVYFQTRHLLLR